MTAAPSSCFPWPAQELIVRRAGPLIEKGYETTHINVDGVKVCLWPPHRFDRDVHVGSVPD